MSIFCYHGVDPAWSSPLAVAPDTFEAQCRWLMRHRLMLDLPEAVERVDRRGRLPRGLAALTFDDGFASLHEHALPVLARHRVPATVFVVAGTLVPEGRPVDWVDDPPAFPLATLTREQLLELHQAGVGIGSHSHTHRDLTLLGQDECERDLRHSRELLEDLLRRPVPFLAYPRGRHNERVRRSARRAGYTHAFTLPESHEPPGTHAIPRVGVYRRNGIGTLRLKAARPYLPLRTSPLLAAIRPHRRSPEPIEAGR
ncbi:MAG: polysaccharide deacetylase family protein [Actinomycetota bacterium]|nr:polysaccharide deacetylase family protein [Actinomycetota bacterium]